MHRVKRMTSRRFFGGARNHIFADATRTNIENIDNRTITSVFVRIMVFGILAAVAAVPAIVGTTEAVRQGQRQNAREEHRGRKSNLTITLPVRNSYSERFDGAMVVLKDNKLYIDTEHSRLGANMACLLYTSPSPRD